MTQGKLAPLDYDVEIPRLIPLVINDDHFQRSPRYLRRYDHVPLFGEYAPTRDEDDEGNFEADYDDFIKDSYTLRELVSYFEKFVALVAKVTKSLREPDLQDWERKELLDMFYGDEWADWGNYSPRDNYYYAQSVPELRAVEVALFFLSSPDYSWKMDVSEVCRHIDQLKLELWQCLPDFYAAHDHPMPRPFSYRSSRPYPLFHVADDFVSGLRPVIPEWIGLGYKEESKKYLPDESDHLQVDRLAFEIIDASMTKDVVVKTKSGQSFYIDTQTYFTGHMYLAEMIEDVATCKDPASFKYEAEGPTYHFITAATTDPRLVKFVMYEEWMDAKRNKRHRKLHGIFERQQLVFDLMKLCELLCTYSSEIRYAEPQLGLEVMRRVKRLKSIM